MRLAYTFVLFFQAHGVTAAAVGRSSFLGPTNASSSPAARLRHSAAAGEPGREADALGAPGDLGHALEGGLGLDVPPCVSLAARAVRRWSPLELVATMGACLAVAAGLWLSVRQWAWGDGNALPAERAATADAALVGEPHPTHAEKEYRQHRIPWQQYCALGFWFMLLFTNAAFTRLVCYLNIPRDCHERTDPIRELDSASTLLSMGFVLAVLTCVSQRDRFQYLFAMTRESNFRGICFFVLFMGSSPVFGSLDLIPSLSRFSLTSGSSYSLFFNILLLFLVLGAVALVVFHFVWAFRSNSIEGFVTYTVSRAVVWLVYIAYFLVSEKTSTADFHLHHYMVGYLVAVLAEFNHPVSLALLAIGSGIFVQGIAAYDADPLIYRRA